MRERKWGLWSDRMPTEPTNYADIANAIAAWFALVVSAFSFLVSRQAHRLAEKAEARKSPNLFLYLDKGFSRTEPKQGDKIYAFLISINNRSDADNSVATIELHVTYLSPNKTELTIKVKSDATLLQEFSASGNALMPPLRIDAHQTVSGWCCFKFDNVILNGGKIEKHVISATDSYGNEAKVEPLIIQEYSHELMEKE